MLTITSKAFYSGNTAELKEFLSHVIAGKDDCFIKCYHENRRDPNNYRKIAIAPVTEIPEGADAIVRDQIRFNGGFGALLEEGKPLYVKYRVYDVFFKLEWAE